VRYERQDSGRISFRSRLFDQVGQGLGLQEGPSSHATPATTSSEESLTAWAVALRAITPARG
jgi:hypothetical protein